MYPIPSPFTKPLPPWRQTERERARVASGLEAMRRVAAERAAKRAALPLVRVKPRWRRCELDDLPSSARSFVALLGDRDALRHGHAGEATVVVARGVRAWWMGGRWNGATIDGRFRRTRGEAEAAL